MFLLLREAEVMDRVKEQTQSGRSGDDFEHLSPLVLF